MNFNRETQKLVAPTGDSTRIYVCMYVRADSFQNFILLGGRRSRSRVRIYRDEFERDDGVPRVPLPEEKNGANGDVNGGAGL